MDPALGQRVARIDDLVRGLEAIADAGLRSRTIALVETLMDFNAAAIERMLDIAYEAGEPGWAVIDACGEDPAVSPVLLLYGLHPVDLETRVGQALDRTRPYLNEHGGDVELVGIEGGVVRLRLIGACDGCPSSRATLESSIERAILETAPDVKGIVCGTAGAAPSGLVDLEVPPGGSRDAGSGPVRDSLHERSIR